MLDIIIITITICLHVYGRQNNARPSNVHILIPITCYRICWNITQNMVLNVIKLRAWTIQVFPAQ